MRDSATAATCRPDIRSTKWLPRSCIMWKYDLYWKKNIYKI